MDPTTRDVVASAAAYRVRKRFRTTRITGPAPEREPIQRETPVLSWAASLSSVYDTVDMLHAAFVRSALRSVALIGTGILFTFALAAAPVHGQVDTGLKTTANTAFGKNASLNTDLPAVIGTFIKAALSFVGVIFLVLVIYGGFLWMTAGGSEQNVTKAKGIITSAIIGMVIIAAGYALTSFVLTSVTSATLGTDVSAGS